MRATSINRYQKTFYGYNAEGYDPKTGSVYLRARYYNTRTGNFSSKDTYLGSLMEPLSLNRYAYAQGNSVNYKDPSGHDAERERIMKEYRERYNSLSDQERAEIANQNRTAVVKYYKVVGSLAVLVASVVVTVMSMGATAPVLAAEIEYYGLASGKAALCAAQMGLAANEASFATKKILDANEVITGENYIKDTVYGGDEDLYNFVEGLQGAFMADAFLWDLQVDGATTGNTNSGYEITWDTSITATQETIEGTNIPRSFTINGMSVNGKEIWVHGNATKHMGQVVNHANGSVMVENELMESFIEAVSQILSKVQPGRNSFNVNGWQIGIDGDTGVIFHARYIP